MAGVGKPASRTARGCGAKLVGDGAKSVHERAVVETPGRCRIVGRVAVVDLPRGKIEAVYAVDHLANSSQPRVRAAKGGGSTAASRDR